MLTVVALSFTLAIRAADQLLNPEEYITCVLGNWGEQTKRAVPVLKAEGDHSLLGVHIKERRK